MTFSEPWAIIVGAGPAGLLLALLLSRAGIPVQVLELSDKLDEQPRATHYASPAIKTLRKAGVLEEVNAKGFHPDAVMWRKLNGTKIAGLDQKVLKDYPDRMVCLPLNQLSPIIKAHLERQSNAQISFGYKVTGLGQDGDKAWVDVDTPQGKNKLYAPYIVGCDGANSQIRRSLFGDWEFPGRTWDEQIIATNTYYDFSKYGYSDANFFIHPEHWHMASRISEDGLWRVTYGEVPGLTRDEYLKRRDEKFRTILPGNPEPNEYKVANFSPYKVHQRLAKSMRVGRFLLAADAAHLCNPFGGLGLTGGIVDVDGLSQCLIGIHQELADDSILDKYSEIRRSKYLEMVDPISSENIRRLFDQDPDKALENDEFLKLCLKTEQDDELSRTVQLGVNALMHDFTQYYISSTKEKLEQSIQSNPVAVMAGVSD